MVKMSIPRTSKYSVLHLEVINCQDLVRSNLVCVVLLSNEIM